MSMTKTLAGALSAALMVALAAPAAQANSISGVEGARAKDRQGAYLNGQERELLRRHGPNHGYRYRGYDYGYDAYGGPSVGVYVGPRDYYDPYGY